MPKFAANLSMLFSELPFLDRFAAAAAAGFRAVEFQAPYYSHPIEEVARAARAAGLPVVLFNAPMGDAKKGERGLAAEPGREADFAASIETTLAYARLLACRQVHVLAGRAAGERAAQEEVYIANLRHAADRAAQAGVTLLIEPLNARDNPGYFLSDTRQALGLLDRIAHRNVALQFDLYHCQITEGDLAQHMRALFGRYAHVQIANVPGRHEPGSGEIDFDFLFGLFDELGYQGWIGCEYRPKAGTLAGLGWARRWGIGG